MALDLNEDFVDKVLQTPFISGENLIRFFKWVMKKPGCKMTTSVVNSLIKVICSDLRKNDAYDLWDLVKDIGDKENGVLTMDVLNELIALFSTLGQGKATIEPVCERMLDGESLPDGEQVGKIISWFCRGGKVENAYTVYLLAKEKNKQLTWSSVNFLISSLYKKDETVSLALEMLDGFSREARKYAIKPFSSVIRGLCRMKNLDEAKTLFL
ncbi:hypothetical protein SCA6_010975 [Theobroma cacao]